MQDSQAGEVVRDDVAPVARPHIVQGSAGEMPEYLRKALSESIRADMDDPGRTAACTWLQDRDAPRPVA